MRSLLTTHKLLYRQHFKSIFLHILYYLQCLRLTAVHRKDWGVASETLPVLGLIERMKLVFPMDAMDAA